MKVRRVRWQLRGVPLARRERQRLELAGPQKGSGGRLLGRRVKSGGLNDVDLGWQIARHFETNGLLADLRFVPKLHWEYSNS